MNISHTYLTESVQLCSQVAKEVGKRLFEESMWFQVEPLPDDMYEVSVKEVEGYRLRAIVALVEPPWFSEAARKMSVELLVSVAKNYLLPVDDIVISRHAEEWISERGRPGLDLSDSDLAEWEDFVVNGILQPWQD